MDIEQIFDLFINNGVAVGCLVYFMAYNNKQQAKTQEILKSLEMSIQQLTTIVSLLQEDIKR